VANRYNEKMIFFIRLFILILWSFLRMLWEFLAPTLPFLGSCMIGFAVFLAVVFSTRQQPLSSLITFPAQHSTETEKKIRYWEDVLVKQPTDRDVLLHLGLLHQQEGDAKKADVFFARAKEIDPNFRYP
jgi:hypothetical protein